MEEIEILFLDKQRPSLSLVESIFLYFNNGEEYGTHPNTN